MQLETDSRDDAERALGTDEKLQKIGPDGSPSAVTEANEVTVGQDDVESVDHVLDLAVPGGELTSASARDPAAHGADGVGGGPVPQRHAILRLDLLLEDVAENTGL